jgi:LEA14-like dessication related protein
MAQKSFFGRHPVLGVLLGLLIVLIAGGFIGYKATDNGKKLLPTLENASMNVGNITADSLKAQMQVNLRNHAPLGLRIDSFSYVTRIDGERMAQGRQDEPTVVKRRGSSQLEIPVSVDMSQLKRKIKDMQQDCVDVEMTMQMYTRLPLVGTEKIPVRVSKKVYVPKMPKIEVADVDVTDLGLKHGEALVKLKVTNYNPFPVTIRSVKYRLRIGGDDMDVKGLETKDVTFNEKGTEIMPIRVSFEPKAMPKVAFKALFKADKTAYDLDGVAVVAAGRHNPKDMQMNFNSEGTLQELKNIPRKGE